MIAKMLKTYVVSKRERREGLLEALRNLGVVHLAPVDKAQAVAHEETVAAIDRLRRAQQLLGEIKPGGTRPHNITTIQAAEEALRIHRVAAERRNRLANLHRQINQLAVWGDARLDQFAALREAGVRISFYSLPARDAGAIVADLVQVVAARFGRGVLVAVVQRDGEPEIPDSAEPVELPPRDRSSLRTEAAEIDKQLTVDENRLAELAHFAKGMQEEIDRLTATARFTIAERGGLVEGELYAVQGWIPADKADDLKKGLAAAGIDAGVELAEPQEEDRPPTLIRYPNWVKPIKGLFDILQTSPGYKEKDVSGAFMVALPIFAAMLIGDAGYGLLFLVIPALLYRKACAKMGKPLTLLVMIIGATSIIWGVAISSFFGVDSQTMIQAGGFWQRIGMLFDKLHILTVSISDSKAQAQIMRLCFLIGVIHLNVAHLWRAIGLFPNLRFLCNVGWAVFLWGMLFVVRMLVVGDPLPYFAWWLLGIGTVLTILFNSPSKNPIKLLGLGIANWPLAAISTLSDIISYVRLFAVGVASGVLAVAFNEMALGTGSIVKAIPILVLGHTLNIILGIIALFAHGVRLNMLEFSNNIGMEWSGYPFKPFAKTIAEEK